MRVIPCPYTKAIRSQQRTVTMMLIAVTVLLVIMVLGGTSHVTPPTWMVHTFMAPIPPTLTESTGTPGKDTITLLSGRKWKFGLLTGSRRKQYTSALSLVRCFNVMRTMWMLVCFEINVYLIKSTSRLKNDVFCGRVTRPNLRHFLYYRKNRFHFKVCKTNWLYSF